MHTTAGPPLRVVVVVVATRADSMRTSVYRLTHLAGLLVPVRRAAASGPAGLLRR